MFNMLNFGGNFGQGLNMKASPRNWTYWAFPFFYALFWTCPKRIEHIEQFPCSTHFFYFDLCFQVFSEAPTLPSPYPWLFLASKGRGQCDEGGGRGGRGLGKKEGFPQGHSCKQESKGAERERERERYIYICFWRPIDIFQSFILLRLLVLKPSLVYLQWSAQSYLGS